MTKIKIKKGEIEMLWCFQIFDCKFFTVFKIKKMYAENHSKRKNVYYAFYKNIFLKKELRAGTSRKREHLLYIYIEFSYR